MALRALAQVAEGQDPLDARQKEARGETMADLCQAYLARHAVHKKSGDEDERRINRHILPRWRNIKVKAITRADVATLHHALAKTAPYEANRLVALLRKMFNLARQWGFLDEMAPNPAQGLAMNREKKRDRWVTPLELPALTRAIDQEENIYARCALWLYLLTGLRKPELLAAKWEDIDTQRRELRIPDTKAERTHYVPLSDAAWAVLENIPVQESNPYIFPGLKPGKPLVNINKPWQRVRRAAGVEDVRLHDLRRTVGSWLAQSGNSLHLIGRVLNHSNPSTTAIYARFAQDQVRQALEDHGKRLMGIAGKVPAAEAIAIAKRKRKTTSLG